MYPYPHGSTPGQPGPASPYGPSYYPPTPGQHGLGMAPAVGAPPVAMEPVPGTPFGVYVVGVAPTRSGFAAASLVTGVASILVSTVVACFGVAGASGGWGPRVSGAFAVLAAVAGIASVVLGRLGLRQTGRAEGWTRVTGRGVAIWGLVCGSLGLLFTLAAFALSLAVAGVDLTTTTES